MNKYVLRRLLHSPLFTVVTLLTLAIGIGANTAIFSVVDGILLKPLPFAEPGRLVGLWHTAKGINLNEVNLCPSLYFTYREQARSFTDIGAYNGGSVSVTHVTKPEQVSALFASDGVLPLLGVQPALGRFFTRRDDTDGSPRTAILAYGYWRNRFGGSPSAIGHHIIVDGEDREIIGVLPRTFEFTDPKLALILPLQLNRNKAVLGNFSYRGIARLKPGVTLAQANADIGRLIPIWLKSWPPPPGFSAKLFEDARLGPNLRPFMQDVVGDIGNVLWLIMGTIGLVLLIACANVANLLLVRAEGRQHELAVRAALGAGWGRIARDLLGESVLLGLAGGALGLALAFGSLQLLVALGPANLPRLNEVGINPRALLFTLAVSLVSGLLFGLLPVFKYAVIRPGTGLRDSSRSVSAGRDRLRARNLLVVFQVALALVLLISSGLMIRTFYALRQIQPGFTNPEQVMTLRVYIPESQIKEPERAMRSHQEILSRISAIPGVEAASFTSAVTMSGNDSSDVLSAEDHPVADGKVPPIRRYKFIAPGYFHAMGRQFLAGRDLTWTEIFGLRPVALVSENLAREYWGSPAAALGKRVREGMKDDWREIIGVVANEYDDGVQTKPPTVVYWPILVQNFWGEKFIAQRTATYVIRSKRTGSAAFLNDLQRMIWSVTPDSPLFDVRTLQEIYGRSMARTSFTLIMLGIAGAMALILGLVGIYGVISYSVSQRTREIGIRMALGARQQQVSGMFVRHGLVLAALGVVFGLAAALALTRLMSSVLFAVKANDPSTYIFMSAGLIAAAMLASYLPSRRATAIDPIETLRAE
ncbi:MAG TPA: ABC transporter permease [Bryobacteraceae bacterium]|jgi:predicted permease